MKDRHQVPPYPLRLPAELKHQITRAAFVMGRSFNSEAADRLAKSFSDPPATPLPEDVEQAVQRDMKERGGTREEALARLVRAGQAQGGTVVTLSITPGTTVEQVKEMIDTAAKLLPADATIVMERNG